MRGTKAVSEIGWTAERGATIITEIETVIVGKRQAVEAVVIGLLCSGHILIEDIPGVGKTMLAKALAGALGASFRRVQFTPDLLPADVTGTSVFNQKTGEFAFRPGPVFTNVLLADEINRATPRTQSALLEAMSERQVSVDGLTYALPRPFMVIATQNPVEFEGTYPLPESQLDRFLLRLPLGYPDREVELQVLVTHRDGEPVDSLEPALDCEQITRLQQAVRQVKVDDAINRYLLDIIEATRSCADLQVGTSTRGTLALYRAGQAAALVAGRSYVVPDDVKQLAVPVLAHRVITSGYVHGGQREAVEALIERLVDEVRVPA